MSRYYKVNLGPKNSLAQECFDGGYIAIGQVFGIDFTHRLADEWREFNNEFIPIYLEQFPGKSRIGAGLSCGALWTVCKGIQIGDKVVCPDGNGSYRVGVVTGDYQYAPESFMPHHRPVKWLELSLSRSQMSEGLAGSVGTRGTVCEITKHEVEIEQLIGALPIQEVIVTNSPDIEDPTAFALEKHLEDFLVRNWKSTLLAKEFDIFTEDGEPAGQQYRTDIGEIDILAISKDQSRLLVIELKRGRASDVVVGQVLRYMGYIKSQVAESHQCVEGAIIALEDDLRIQYALAAVQNVTFYRYKVKFELEEMIR
jgi:restriction system protein